MWTNRAHFIVVYFRINRFFLPIALPAYIINSLITEIGDLVNFFTFFSKRVTSYVNLAETTIHSLCEFKKYDFVDIDVESKHNNDKVKIKICTR